MGGDRIRFRKRLRRHRGKETQRNGHLNQSPTAPGGESMAIPSASTGPIPPRLQPILLKPLQPDSHSYLHSIDYRNRGPKRHRCRASPASVITRSSAAAARQRWRFHRNRFVQCDSPIPSLKIPASLLFDRESRSRQRLNNSTRPSLTPGKRWLSAVTV